MVYKKYSHPRLFQIFFEKLLKILKMIIFYLNVISKMNKIKENMTLCNDNKGNINFNIIKICSLGCKLISSNKFQ